MSELGSGILRGAGASAGTAATVAKSLVESNLVGHDSHGVRRLAGYVDAVRADVIDPVAEPELHSQQRGTAVIAGNRAFGQLSAGRAVLEAVRLCSAYGVSTVVVRECNHAGRLGEYVADLAGRGMVALALSNADPTVAPFGGRNRKLGTNPMAWALPRGATSPPLVMDWATAAVAEGKLAVAEARGERVGLDLLLDPQGRVSTDPGDFYRGGALLPFGGHKGYGLSVVIEIVGGLLAGAGVSSLPGYDGRFGTVFIAVDIGCFMEVADFRAQAEAFCAELAGTEPAEGHREVLVPGELEARTRRERARDGIPFPDSTWHELTALRETLHGEPVSRLRGGQDV